MVYCSPRMERLLALLNSLTKEERAQFAKDTGFSLGHLRNVAYGDKPCKPECASAIERESAKFGVHRKVNRWDLIPDDWWWIYPELVGKEGAPQLPEKARSAA